MSHMMRDTRELPAAVATSRKVHEMAKNMMYLEIIGRVSGMRTHIAESSDGR